MPSVNVETQVFEQPAGTAQVSHLCLPCVSNLLNDLAQVPVAWA